MKVSWDSFFRKSCLKLFGQWVRCVAACRTIEDAEATQVAAELMHITIIHFRAIDRYWGSSSRSKCDTSNGSIWRCSTESWLLASLFSGLFERAASRSLFNLLNSLKCMSLVRGGRMGMGEHSWDGYVYDASWNARRFSKHFCKLPGSFYFKKWKRSRRPSVFDAGWFLLGYGTFLLDGLKIKVGDFGMSRLWIIWRYLFRAYVDREESVWVAYDDEIWSDEFKFIGITNQNLRYSLARTSPISARWYCTGWTPMHQLFHKMTSHLRRVMIWMTICHSMASCSGLYQGLSDSSTSSRHFVACSFRIFCSRSCSSDVKSVP